MKYPLTPAEERLKEKIAKQKAARKAAPNVLLNNKYQQRVYNNDFMKYWKVVRYWIKHKYGITQYDLDMLFFLYSEGYFTFAQMKEYNAIFPWDKNRFKRLVAEGWIYLFRRHTRSQVALYHISKKGHAMIKDIYNKLNGQVITESVAKNKMFREDASYTEKVHRHYIKKLNASIRQERRHVRVSRLKLRRRESLYDLRHGQSEQHPPQQ